MKCFLRKDILILLLGNLNCPIITAWDFTLLLRIIPIMTDWNFVTFHCQRQPRTDLYLNITAWKLSVFGIFLVRILPHSDWIRRDIILLSVFSPNTGKYGLEKLQIRALFMQCIRLKYFDYFVLNWRLVNY